MPQSKFIVRKVAVLGAGVMGAQIAAHLANANVDVVLFDLPAKDGNPNGIVLKAIEGLKKQKPSPLAGKQRADFITPANYDQHIELLQGCDLVIEAIAERLDWKLALYEKVAPHLGAQAIFATNTSGLSINKLADGCPESMRSRFCGIHFFNPPRYMHLVEIIPCHNTDAELLDRLEAFLVTTIGKGVIRAKDTPNFVANRVGVFSMLAAIRNAATFGIRFDVVDDLTGPRLGRPKSATFRTADVVGLDTFAHVVKTMRDNLPDDPWFELFTLPAWLDQLIGAGALGAKTKAGIYKREGKALFVLDPATGAYVESNQKGDDALKELIKIKDPGKRLLKLRESKNPEGQFLWACFRDVFHYIAVHLDTIADNARDIDLAIRWGFGWDQGPFETWQAAGWQQVAGWIKEDIEAGKTLSNAPLPDWVFDGREGVHTPDGSYSASRNALVPRSTLDVYQRQLFPARLVGEPAPVYGETVFENEGARLWTTGDGVLVITIISKAHAIGPAVLAGINHALELAEAEYQAVVIWSPDEPFSVGADLASMLPAFSAGDWGAIEDMLAQFQIMTSRLRYSQIPVVVATRGYAFGGGCEVCLHADRVVAHLESYVGLVEVGVGLLPAAGGTKEFALRAAQEARGGDILAMLKDRYLTIATANVATSAEQARELGFFRPDDVIVFNQYELLHVAKTQALALAEAGYRAPLPPRGFPVAGRAGAASIKGQLVNMREGGFISAYDYEISSLIADIITGGNVEAGTLVDEQWILSLERKGFMQLLRNEKTQERIAYMLQNNKPLRN